MPNVDHPSPGDCRCCCCWNRPVSCIMIFTFVSAIGFISTTIGWFGSAGSLKPVYEEFASEEADSTDKLDGWNNTYAGLLIEVKPFATGVNVKFCPQPLTAYCAFPRSDRRGGCFIGADVNYDECVDNEEFESQFLSACPNVESKAKSLVRTEIAIAVFSLIYMIIGISVPWVFIQKWKKPDYEKQLTGESPGYQPGVSTNDIPKDYPWFMYIFLPVYTLPALCSIILMIMAASAAPECSVTGTKFGLSPDFNGFGSALTLLLGFVSYAIVVCCVSCCWYGGWKEKYDSWISRTEQERAIEMQSVQQPAQQMIVGPDGIPVLQFSNQQQQPQQALPVQGTVVNNSQQPAEGLPPMLAAAQMQQQQSQQPQRSEEEDQQWPSSNNYPPQASQGKEQPNNPW